MMYSYKISAELEKILKKLYKRDKIRYEAALKKMQQVCLIPQHFKNLQYNLKEFKRVHIDSSFVIVFKVDENTKTIYFEDLDHHDIIYKKWASKTTPSS